jgi:hypothetical protein
VPEPSLEGRSLQQVPDHSSAEAAEGQTSMSSSVAGPAEEYFHTTKYKTRIAFDRDHYNAENRDEEHTNVHSTLRSIIKRRIDIIGD